MDERIAHHYEYVESTKFKDLIRHYREWWFASDSEKDRCAARMEELTAGRSFTVGSMYGDQTDETLRRERCLDIYSHVFGGDALPIGGTSMTASPSIESVGEYLFVYINSFIGSRNDLIGMLEKLAPETVARTRTVVIDGRSNPGGSVEVLHDVMNVMFSPKPGVQYLKPRGKVTYGTHFETNRTGMFAGRDIRILTDAETGSSTEWMVETLCYEWYPDSCVSLGTKTLGKAILQCSQKMSYPDQRFSVKLTCGEWFLVNKRKTQDPVVEEKVQGIGIEADQPLTFPDCDRYAYACIAKKLTEAGL
jgi:hypothetical protein